MSKKLREFEEPSFEEKVKAIDMKILDLKNKSKEVNNQVINSKAMANAASTQAGRAVGVTPEVEAQDKKMKTAQATKSREESKYYQTELDKLKDEIKTVELEKANLLKNKNIQQENTMAQLTKQDILRILESSESARMTKSELVETISNKLLKEDMNDDVRRKIESGENDYSSHLDRETVKRMADNIMGDIRSNLQAKTGGGASFDAAQSVLMQGLMSALPKEHRHKAQLEQLAVRLVREEYGIPEDAVDFDAKIMGQTPIQKQGLKMRKGNKRPPQGKTEEELKPNVTKRRLMNAMMHGAARKGQNLFHMAAEELRNINPSLVQDYSKMMAGNDFMYWAMDDETIARESEHGTHAGQVRVDLSGEKPKIIAQGMTFPFLLHELTKGVLELMSLHGLDADKETRDYVLDKTDNLESESWDIRLGPKIWEKFLEALDVDDLPNKSHIFNAISTLPPTEFNSLVNGLLNDREEAKNKVRQIADDIRRELNQEDVDTALGQFSDEGGEEHPDDETPTAGDDDDGEDPVLRDLLNKPNEPEEDDFESWSKRDLERGIDDALDAGDYATVRKLTDILNSKY